MSKTLVYGKVVSDKMNKTRVVEIERVYRHPKYKKIIRRTTKFYAHDENNATHTGDYVYLKYSRPLSALKRWVIVDVRRPGSPSATLSDSNNNDINKNKETFQA